MIALLQRVSSASVTVEDAVVGAIEQGLLVLIGIQPEDTEAKGEQLLRRVLDYRVFADADGRMNRSLRDVSGGLLLVSQFTLAADTTRGLRPSFTSAAAPDVARHLFDSLLRFANSVHAPVASGVFGADMKVALVNDGPVTFWLEV
ncbi:MAG: D-aminoacyl-tRNA deacylase [Gammaproteobacteria bacterium]|jgi:D-tyrosyl-tRNA(Tyr) deacylase|nr:D-aminoacyl-tRNA deacylase [Gammaproteobacteria bacterium]